MAKHAGLTSTMALRPDIPRAPPRATRPHAIRILILATEDWFVVSHFLPLLRALKGIGADVAVATRLNAKRDALLAEGVRVIDFDFSRGSLHPLRDASAVARLHRLVRRERPDAIHAIALKPIVLACLSSWALPPQHLAVHLTGVGLTGTVHGRARALVYAGVMRLIARVLRRKTTWLFVENTDDLDRLATYGPLDPTRVTLLGGAGVDPEHYPPTPLPQGTPLRIGFVGRMIWSKGVDVLVAAHARLRAAGVLIDLDLCGSPDADNPRAISLADLQRWNLEPGIRWLGRSEDIAGFWRGVSIAVVPSRGGEGLPRALLEAAACGRPAVVTDVPGCRHFVRDGVDGLIVPPDDVAALANAIARLAGDPEMAQRLGTSARQRVLDGFTEAHVIRDVQTAYQRLMQIA